MKFHASMFQGYNTVYKDGYGTAEHKAKFANDLIGFVQSGFNPNKFTKKLYRTLSNCFGHIAHYDQSGFYVTWFSTTQQQLDWLRHVAFSEIYGDPGFTMSDVEKQLRDWIRNSGLVAVYQQKVDLESKTAELNELARLRAKYPEA